MRIGAENKIVLNMIRHGNTPSNIEHRYLGTTDEGLADEGKKALQGVRVPEADMIYCGPMRRCLETRSILYGEAEYRIVEELTEIDFGDFEGKNYKELSENPDYQAWIDSGGTIAFPNGESREDFIARSIKGYQEVIDDAVCCGFSNISVVLHGGNIMAIISSMYGGEYFDYQVKPGRGYSCTVDCTGRMAEIKEI